MASWQVAQTIRVLRRILAMSAAHAGWPGPASPRLASLRTWWHQHLARLRAQLAPPLQEPVDQLLAGVGDRDGRAVAEGPHSSSVQAGSRRTWLPGPACRRGGSWPRSRHAARTVSRSWPCTWRPSSSPWTGAWRPGSSASTSRRASAASPQPPDVAGKQVVAGNAPVFGSVDLDDVVVVQVLQGGPVPGFAVAPVGGTFRLDHVQGHPQRDRAVDRPAAAGDLVVGVLDDDLIAEVAGRPGAGVGDQGLIRVEFEREFIAQEPCQLILDLLGFGFRSDEPQEMIVGVPE